MKQKFQLMALAGALVLGSACAQRPAAAQTTTSQAAGERGGRRGGDRMQRLFTGITLSADQQARVQAIRERHQNDMQGLDPRNNPDDRTKIQQNMQAQMNEVRALLSADQQTQFDKNVAEMRNDRQQRRGGPGGP